MYKFNRPYVLNKGRKFAPIYLPGENYSFYINSEFPIDDTNLPFQLWVIDGTGTQVALIGTLATVFVAGTVGYNLYMNDFVFPNSVNDGYYYFQIWCPSLGVEIYRGNPISVNSFCIDSTTPVKFRHNDVLYGVRYDLLPNFYQKFRLPINQVGPPEISSDRTQYRQSSNGRELRNNKSFRDIKLTLELYWANDNDFGALSAMLEHDEIYISGNRIIEMSQVKTSKPMEQSNQTKGTFEVIVNDYNLADTLENYGDFILWGGNNANVLNTFVQG